MDTDERSDELSGAALVRRASVLGVLAAIASNTISTLVVITLIIVVLPLPPGSRIVTPLTASLTGAYVLFGFATGITGGLRLTRSRLRWLVEDRTPEEEDRRRAVRIPLRVSQLQAALWLGAALLFGGVYAAQSWLLATEVGTTVLIGGLASSASSFLAVEVLNRPILARTLDDAPREVARGAGVTGRALLVWLYGTGLPLIGTVLFTALNFRTEIDVTALRIWVIVVASLTITTSGLLTLLVARSVAHPLEAVRDAVRRMDRGERGVEVPVTDAGELGVLQLAVNEFARGIDERDQLRDLFGRHVGVEVARRALDEGVELGGELRDVAVLFVDVMGSTSLAQELDPHTFVERLNRVFAAAVSCIDDEGGTVTNFAGDAVVAVWGAPTQHPAPAAGALLAGRRLATMLDEDTFALPAGIGIAWGSVVAGNIGSTDRLEYTVIGDAVNVAARLTGEAKQRAVTVLADRGLLATAGAEAENWEPAGSVELRGRSERTLLATPRG